MNELENLNPGDTATVEGQIVYVGPPTVNATDVGDGRTGRTVTVFVETEEDPAAVALDSAGNAQDPRTFAELTEGADSFVNRPDVAASPAAQRPDVVLAPNATDADE